MISFDPLWQTLKAEGLKRTDLQKLTGLSSATIAKIGKNEVVKLDVVDRICTSLHVPIYDVVQIFPDATVSDCTPTVLTSVTLSSHPDQADAGGEEKTRHEGSASAGN